MQLAPIDIKRPTAVPATGRPLGAPPAHLEPATAPAPATSADELRARWLGAAARHAGIDLAQWDPARGTAHNRDIVRASYRYYADLFLDHPFFEWAGVANAIAPTFAAAFDDLAVINRHLGRWDGWLSDLPGPVHDALQGAVGAAARFPVQQFRNVELTLLAMQKEIFVDQATMHEAYLGGGLDAIRELRGAGVLDDHAVRAWEQLDEGRRTGRADLVTAANKALLWREQMQVVADDYDSLREAGRLGPVLTYALTLAGRPAVPGSRTPGQFDPIGIGPIRLPLPSMDVSRREDRWRMTEGDTLPAFDRLRTGDPEGLRRLIASDLDQRIADARLRRLPDDASALDVALLLTGLPLLVPAEGVGPGGRRRLAGPFG